MKESEHICRETISNNPQRYELTNKTKYVQTKPALGHRICVTVYESYPVWAILCSL